ncbi:DUF6575 domain-containing protein [Azospirillum sp. B4]|uniref:DUF6575 domain-containing protein n=1 Tax=Azospirillum sp. B4 TaxID=95605 RepID=UPI0011DDF189|nr:DUF6575 domain-containing protein [Azospirillum sp. B4]
MERSIKIIDTIIYYDGDRLFFGKGDSGRYYLALNVEESEDSTTWLYAPVSIFDYLKIRSHASYFGDYFKEENTPYLLTSKARENIENQEAIRVLKTSEIPSEWLPQGTLDDQKLLFQELPRDSWIFNQILSFEGKTKLPIEIAANRHRRPMTDVRFIRTHGTDNGIIPVTVLGKALQALQHLVDSIAAALENNTSTRGRISDSIRSKVQLDAIAAYPSSFGIRLEAKEADLLGESLSGHVFEKLDEILKAKHQKDNLRIAISPLGARAVAHYKSFTKALSLAEVDVTFSSAVPGDLSPRSAKITYQEATEILSTLEKENIYDGDQLSVVGKLIGLSLRTRYFMLEANEHTYRGKISQKCLADIGNKATVGDPYIATISVTVEIKEYSGDTEDKFELVSLVAIPRMDENKERK